MDSKIRYILSAMLISASVTHAGAAPTSDWKVDIAPYIWAINLNGDVGVGKYEAHIDESFSNLLKDLDIGAMLWVNIHYKKFGVFADPVYGKLSNNSTVDGVKIDTTDVYSVIGTGASYQVLQVPMSRDSRFTLEPYAGARITINNTTLKVLGDSFKKDEQWTDIIIGSRAIFDFGQTWHISLSSDYGGMTGGDHHSYNLVGVAGYTFALKPIPFSVYAGYRYLDQFFTTGNGPDFYKWDMAVFGPLLGLNMQF